jgi:mycoredoxin
MTQRTSKINMAIVCGLIIATGIGAGYAATAMSAKPKPAYIEGNFTAYFPDRSTKVVLYGTAWCDYCAQARAYFIANHIAFVDLDIERSEQARRQHEQLGGGAVPLLLVGDRKMSGFNPATVQAAVRKLRG